MWSCTATDIDSPSLMSIYSYISMLLSEAAALRLVVARGLGEGSRAPGLLRARRDHATIAAMADTTVDAPPGMVLVPAGPFRFGNGLDEVTLGALFCDRDPVTYADYAR